MKTNGLPTGGFPSCSRSQAPRLHVSISTAPNSTPWTGLSKEERRLIVREGSNGDRWFQGTQLFDVLAALSVWLSWTAAPPTSGLLVFSRREDWPPLYGLPWPWSLPPPGPSSLCSREARWTRSVSACSCSASPPRCCAQMSCERVS